MATSKQRGVVTKIYRFEAEGISAVKSDIQSVTKDLEKLKQAKIALNKLKVSVLDPKEVEDIQRKIDAITQSQAKLVSTSVGAFHELITEHKNAKIAVQEVAAEFGAESQQAAIAAAAVQDYRQQLTEVINLAKSGAKPTAAVSTAVPVAAIPSTDNLRQLEEEQIRTAAATGTAISELEAKEAEAANAATTWVNTQVLGREAVEDLGEAAEAIKIPLQEYTGSLDSNIRQNLAYKTRLGEINAELKVLDKQYAAGNLSLKDYQNKTAGLVKEQTALKTASAELSQTINAQTKYVQAAEGSMDQLNARLGLSRDLYRQLSEEEKISPFGRKLSSDIAVMDSNLKKADASLGNFQRNVGNYGSAFTGAISKTFGFVRQLAYVIPGIGIGGIISLAFDQVTNFVSAIFKGGDALNTYAANLQNVNDVMAEGNKQAGSQLINLKLLYTVATDANKPLADRLAAVQALKHEFPDYFGQLDNEIILNGQAKDSYDKLTESILAASRATAGRKKLDELEAKRLDVSFQKKKITSFTDYEKSAVSSDRKVVDFNLVSEEDAKNFSAGELLAKQQAADIKNVQAIIDARRNKALTVQDKIDASLQAQEKFIQNFVGIKGLAGLNTGPQNLPPAAGSLSAVELQLYIKKVEEEISVLKEGSPKLKELQEERNSFQKRLDAITKKEKAPREKASVASRLTAGIKDSLKVIESDREEQISIENTSVNEIQRIRTLTFDEELQHIQKVEKINVVALDQKIDLLKKKQTLNAEEKVTLAKFEEEKSTIELQASEKSHDIEKRRFTDQEQDLKNHLDKSIQTARDANDKIQENVNATPSEKVQAKLDADNQILAYEREYYSRLLQLNSDYNDQALVQAQKAIDATKKLVDKDVKELSLATLADIDKAIDKAVADIKLKYDKLKKEILESDKSKGDKDAALKVLTKVENVEIDTSKLDGANKAAKAAKELLDAGLITLEQYEAIYAKATQGQENLNKSIEEGKKSVTSMQGLLTSTLGNLFGFAEGSDKAKLLAETISQAFNTAKVAMQDYFDSEAERINRSRDLTIERIQLERDQKVQRAQSQAEIDSLNKEAAAKEEATRRDALEKNKKLQKAQALINLGIQLSNLAVIAFSPNPANIATLGAAGIVMYAIQAAIALVNYGLTVSRINSATYARGGRIPVDAAGTITGPSHKDGGVPFTFRGRQFEVEGGEGIVNKKSMADRTVRTFKGTNSEVLSFINRLGGGSDFQPGAKPTKFANGGYLGSALEAPYYIPSSVGGGKNEAILAELKRIAEKMDTHSDKIDAYAKSNEKVAEETNKRIDRFKTVVSERDITNAQKKEFKRTGVGRLNQNS